MHEMEKYYKVHMEKTQRLGISIGTAIPKEIPIKNANLKGMKNSFISQADNFKNPLQFPEC